MTILSRKESSSAFPSNFVVKRADYSNEQELVDALAGQDAVVLALGSLALGPTGIFIDAAARAGVKRFIPSHVGAALGLNEMTEGALAELLSFISLAHSLARTSPTPRLWTSYHSWATRWSLSSCCRPRSQSA